MMRFEPCTKCNHSGYYGIVDNIGRVRYYTCEDCKGEGYIHKDEVPFKNVRLPRWFGKR